MDMLYPVGKTSQDVLRRVEATLIFQVARHIADEPVQSIPVFGRPGKVGAERFYRLGSFVEQWNRFLDPVRTTVTRSQAEIELSGRIAGLSELRLLLQGDVNVGEPLFNNRLCFGCSRY